MDRIAAIKGREILNAKGRPTVEAQLITERGIRVTASVPSGTSRGKYEAFELYDGETRHNGRGARKAAENISTEICRALAGMDVADQEAIDQTLCRLDGTPDKHRLGGNALLAASVAAAKAGAASTNQPVYRYLGQKDIRPALPDILATVIAGGVFSTSGMEFEDYMAVFHGFSSFPEELDALCDFPWKKRCGDVMGISRRTEALWLHPALPPVKPSAGFWTPPGAWDMPETSAWDWMWRPASCGSLTGAYTGWGRTAISALPK